MDFLYKPKQMERPYLVNTVPLWYPSSHLLGQYSEIRVGSLMCSRMLAADWLAFAAT